MTNEEMRNVKPGDVLRHVNNPETYIVVRSYASSSEYGEVFQTHLGCDPRSG